MDTEQEKVNEFLDKFTDIGGEKKWARIGVAIVVVLVMVGCSIPVQDIFGDMEEFKPFMLLPMGMGILSMFGADIRILPYKMYTEKANSLGVVLFLLEYHPINKKQILKKKLLCQIQFVAKLALLGLAVQLISTYAIYRTISWINIGYIFLYVFLVPAFHEIFQMRIRKKHLYGE